MLGEEAYLRIQELKKINDIPSDRELERKAGATNGTIRNIRNGTKVSSVTLTAIAEVLHTTTGYIINGVEAPQENEASEMDAYVGKLVNCLSRLNEKNRKMILELAESLLQGQ